MDTPPEVLCGGGGDEGTDQAPVTCLPNAAQSVVTGGPRANTRETASPSPKEGWRTGPEKEPVLRLAPLSIPRVQGKGSEWRSASR